MKEQKSVIKTDQSTYSETELQKKENIEEKIDDNLKLT